MIEKRIARIVTVMFHPLVMPTLGMLLIFYSGTSLSVVQEEVKRVSLIIVALFSGILPGSLILLLYLTKTISDPRLRDRNERRLPLSLVIIMLLFTFFVMRGIPQLSAGHIGYLLSPSAVLILGLVLHRFMKPSIHLLALGGMVGMMLTLVFFFGARIQYIFIFAVLATGLTASAQQILEEHTSGEVGVGFLGGLFAAVLTMVIFLV